MQSIAKSRICVTGLRGIPSVMGGVETHCEELLPRIAARADELDIEVLGRSPYIAGGKCRYRDVTVTPLPSPRHSHLEALISTAIAVAYARLQGAKLIHIHAIGPGLLAPLARAIGLRVVLTHHGEDYNREKWGTFAKFMLRLGEKAGLASANGVIAVSPTLAERLKQRYPKASGRIVYIPNGAASLEAEGLDPADVLRRFDIEPGRFILSVGRLVPEKGFDYLIRAFRQSRTDMKLVIAGGADHASTHSRSILQQADGRVILCGMQPRSVLKVLYDNAGLFVLPSFHEGLPIAALEAAISGTPMIMSDIQPNRDVGLSEAHYFPVGNTDALSRMLGRPPHSYAIDPNEFRNRFNWDECAQRTLDVYRRIATPGSVRPGGA